MASFLGEIKRRKVVQAAILYIVVAWIVIQVVVSVAEPLNLPGWIDTVVIVLLIAVFPVALVLAWAFQLTQRGVVRDSGDESIEANATGTRTDPESGKVSDGVLPNSVAVLPFENLSPEPDLRSICRRSVCSIVLSSYRFAAVWRSVH